MSSAYRPCLAVLALLLSTLSAIAGDVRIDYPKTPRGDQIDVYHGVKVADPYRWLEADVRTSPEVAEWVAAENKVTSAYLEAIPQRDAIRRRLTELWNFAQYSSPMKAGGRYYYLKNDGLQNQSVLYMMDSLDGEPRVLLDPNTWSKDGTIALAGMGFSDDGKYLAYGVSEAGSDWSTWHVLDDRHRASPARRVEVDQVHRRLLDQGRQGIFLQPLRRAEAGRRVPGHELQQQSSTTIASARRKATTCWSTGGPNIPSGFTRHASPRTAAIWSSPSSRAPTSGIAIDVPRPGRTVRHAGRSDRRFRPRVHASSATTARCSSSRPTPTPRGAADRHRSRQAASRPTGRRSSRKAKRHSDAGVGWSAICSSPAISRTCVPQVKVFAIDGQFVRDVELPGIGTAGGFGGKRTDTETFYSFSSFATPPSIYRYDIAHRQEPADASGRREVQSRRLRGQAGLLHAARTARECRCSSATRRASSSTARTRRCSTATAASTSR